MPLSNLVTALGPGGAWPPSRTSVCATSQSWSVPALPWVHTRGKSVAASLRTPAGGARAEPALWPGDPGCLPSLVPREPGPVGVWSPRGSRSVCDLTRHTLGTLTRGHGESGRKGSAAPARRARGDAPHRPGPEEGRCCPLWSGFGTICKWCVPGAIVTLSDVQVRVARSACGCHWGRPAHWGARCIFFFFPASSRGRSSSCGCKVIESFIHCSFRPVPVRVGVRVCPPVALPCVLEALTPSCGCVGPRAFRSRRSYSQAVAGKVMAADAGPAN